jgi:hypothetical protein
MWNEYKDAIIFGTYCLTLLIGHRVIVGIKAKAFNEGYKRGRATRLASDYQEIK